MACSTPFTKPVNNGDNVREPGYRLRENGGKMCINPKGKSKTYYKFPALTLDSHLSPLDVGLDAGVKHLISVANKRHISNQHIK